MKQNYALKILALFLILTSYSIGAQNQTQVQEIKKDYNLAELKKLKEKLQAEQVEQRRKALRLAQANNWPITYTKEGVFYGLVGVSAEGKPIYYKTDNVAAARSTRANWLHDGGGLGLNIEGQGMTAHVWDGGVARTSHQEYDGDGGQNRFTNGDGGNRNFHAAHVMGTIISSGFVSNVKGMAPKANGIGYDWNNDLSEATDAAMNGMLISNHSYGFDANQINDSDFGKYATLSRNWDEIMYNAPYYLMVVSAGNDGNNNTANANPLEANPFFDKLSFMKVAKNNMVVANGQDASIDSQGNLLSVVRNSSSSEGPTDDLRVKPDIMGNGSGVNSTFHDADNSYDILSGTSMASPNVAGSLLLLQQYYNQQYGNFMRASTLKGLALHTADDVGSNGPDAQHGWGLMNTKRAAEAITNNGLQSLIEEKILGEGETYSITVKSDGTNPLQASISWTDLPGTPNSGANNSTPVLVNDLDIRITQNSDTFNPWRLTGVNSNDRGDNIVDPFERIDIDGASGEYTITISHKSSLSVGSQAFALIVTGVESNFTFNTSGPDQVVCSDSSANFSFDYQQIGSVTTNFSVQNLPTGATANFSSASLSASGSTVLTIDNLDNVPAGNYELIIAGNDGEETELRTVNLQVYHPNFDNNPMSLTSPSNGSVGVASSAELSWNENLNAETYEIEVSDNPSFTNIIATGTESDLDFAVSGLQGNSVYYWRVKPVNRCFSGDYSETFSFQTGIEDCSNTYTATNFDNATIFDSEGNTAYVPIDITDNLSINRLIVNADVTHRSVEDITVFIQQPSQLGSNNTILLDGVCDTSDDLFGVTFDDTGSALVCNTTSPAISGVIAPQESLGSSAGLSSEGVWFFAVTDNIRFDGGSIDAASITVCTATPNTNLPSFTNNTIDVIANDTYVIQTTDIEASTAAETADQQVFTIVTAPERGSIMRNGVALTVGDTFTQEDVDTGLVEYTNTQTEIFTDSFTVDITNGTNGWLPNQVVNLSANVVGADSFELNNFSLYPNPSNGTVFVRFESRTNNNVNVQVFDLQGRSILAEEFEANSALFNESLTVTGLANGVYLVRVTQGDRTTVKNLIISK